MTVRNLLVPLISVCLLYPGIARADNSYNLLVTGTIISTSCDVETTDIQVTLDDIGSDTFVNVGDTSAAKDFHIKLTNCSDGISGGSITFSGTPDTNNTDLLQLTQGEGVATGVAIEILDGTSSTPIPLGASATTQPLKQTDNDLLYQLRYRSTLPLVTAGTANAVMYFDFSYQ